MAYSKLQTRAIWRLAANQHGVVTRAQLLELGFSASSIKHRIAKGRIHPVFRGVYAVGRPQVSEHGFWLAAVLSCGPYALLSHQAAGCLWGILASQPREIDVTVPGDVFRRRPGIAVHRRRSLTPDEATSHNRVPVTTPTCTLIDLGTCLKPGELEAAINEADKLDLINPEDLRAALGAAGGRRGARRLRQLLDRRTFSLTESELERRFLRLVRAAGLPRPQTGVRVNGFKVDFHWPELGLVVETDGLRYHRTPAQQARDRTRDQTHAASGLTPLRFTHAQVRYEPEHVTETLAVVIRRLSTDSDASARSIR
jgi:very-short-patch-repair endonuclease